MTLLSATVTKETKDTKVGIAFTRKGENYPLTIKLIRDGGLFESTELKPGMVVDAINDVSMTWKAPKDAADALRSAEAGADLTITTKVSVGTITKDSKDDKVGISLKNSTTKSGMWISKITPESKFADSELIVGQQVIRINGVDCPLNTKEAIQIVKDAEGELIVVAIDADERVVESEDSPTSVVNSPVAAASEQAPMDAPEEKKDEEVEPVEEGESNKEEDKPAEESADRSAPLDGDENLTEEEKEKKGLLDTVFSACIC